MSELRRQIYNKEDGEIIDDSDYIPKKKHYHYYLTFYSALGKANISLTGTMQVILGQMDGLNRVVLDLPKLVILSNNYKISKNALKIAAGRMCNDGLMQRTSPATYFANPYYFSKANLHRLEMLRREYSELLFDTKQRTKSTEVKRVASLEKQIKDILKR
jgi:hypothetical protein